MRSRTRCPWRRRRRAFSRRDAIFGRGTQGEENRGSYCGESTMQPHHRQLSRSNRLRTRSRRDHHERMRKSRLVAILRSGWLLPVWPRVLRRLPVSMTSQ